MFIAIFGYLLLVLALLVGLYTLYLNIWGIKKNNEKLFSKAQMGMVTIALLVTSASVLFLFALVTDDFSLKYVHNYSAIDLPLAYKIAAFWAGNAGSLLLWAQILAGAGVLIFFSASKKYKDKNLFGVVYSVIIINIIFFLISMILFANPFEQLPHSLDAGRGLNPMLRTPWMVIHPVALYLGYVSWVVPFAFAMGALVLRREDHSWIYLSRSWAVFAWLFLSIGNLLGAQWAYIELGWGGYWAWDPVENASLLPWLTGTAFLHSLMMQERKGMFKTWNIILVIITYCLTLYGTFLVRSGVLSSVHAFAKSNLSYWFGFFLLAMLFGAFYLLATRKALLKGENEIIAFFSKETGFFLTNVLFMCAAFIIFLGTNFPILTQLMTGVKKVVGQDWFNTSAGPVLLAVIFLIGICSLLSWQEISGSVFWTRFLPLLMGTLIFGAIIYFLGISKFWGLIGFSVIFFVLLTIMTQLFKCIVKWWKTGKSAGMRRRCGGYLIHLGVVLFTLGVVGDAFYSIETVKTMEKGETISLSGVSDYSILFQGVKSREEGVNKVVYSDLLVERNGKSASLLTPEKIYYPNWESPRTEVVILGGPVEDLYIVLAGWNDQTEQGTFEIHINPLMNWIWIGGYILILGSMIVIWPVKKKLVKGSVG